MNKDKTQEELEKELGLTLNNNECISEETINEFTGSKGDDENE